MPESRAGRTRTVLLYAQDSKGMGHITRTLTIARHLLAAYSDAVGYITTESPIAGDFALPERCDYIKLPAAAGLRALRAQLLHDTALGLAPDLVLVDHEPLGHKGEFRDGLRALKAHRPTTKFVFGLRDIMDDVGRIRALWRELGVYDVAQAYAIPASVHPKVHYCGYILRELPSVDPGVVRQQLGLPRNGPLVLATVGSGSDGYPVLEAAQAAVHRLQAKVPDLHAILVTGPFMSADGRAALETRATATCRVVPRADNLQLLAAADAVVSMGGYNSVCEALAVARPLVIVPRVTHKIEQQIRAETLAAHGLARWVHPKELSGERLAEALEWALRCDRQAHAQRVRDIIPSFDGASRLTAYLSRWLGGD